MVAYAVLQHIVKIPQNVHFFNNFPDIAEEMAKQEIGDFQLDVNAVKDRHKDKQGIGTIEVDVNPSDVQLMLDGMANSSANFFLGSTGTTAKEDRGERVNVWKYNKENMCNVVLIDEFDQRNLEKTRQLTDVTIKKVQTLLGIDWLPTINN